MAALGEARRKQGGAGEEQEEAPREHGGALQMPYGGRSCLISHLLIPRNVKRKPGMLVHFQTGMLP